MTMSRLTCLGAALLCAGLPALAPTPAPAQTPAVPEGCEAVLSVQSQGCAATLYWRCESAPEGTLFQATYGEEGARAVSVFDAEFQWLDSRHFADGAQEVLQLPAEDPASLSELLEEGRDSYEFIIEESGPGYEREIMHRGFDQLTGNTREIDGEELLETEFTATASDLGTGEVLYSVSGLQYVLEDERLFLLGTEVFEQGGQTIESSLDPVRIRRPGEAGFGDVVPRYGCDAPADISYRIEALR
ncbi:hypothetical protein RM543_02720 [Roseicyclus sp. F158]|uniref:Uncharacterized protein n=1 Tax=Tropicimonas omnivorans TaxID=3075590 RepID=A0ABU3DD47_9RHOB|nr:hypothetical protein [Roseicyclus sp. F158]MDT0681585.1 hypothetical protein [Roseicyclus sp. F158]